ncbi:MAG: BMP family ABC transporter substrate-binding protein [Clostridia bacterium]|nr:BMP family ABC transporter substrate-binding protein [Clostridia bacterium]
MKRVYIATALTAFVMILVFGALLNVFRSPFSGTLQVGFIYENDESTPYTYNFALAEQMLKNKYPDGIEVFSYRNVLESETSEPLRDLLDKGCRIIFTNGCSPLFREIAAEHPDVQFCQVSFEKTDPAAFPENYHTFNGETYQYQYVNGVVAGIKLREMIDSHVLSTDQAVVGFVGNYPDADVVSSFTAFILGVRSIVPEALMHVRYAYSWSSFVREKACAKALIDEGCIVIAQQAHTFGPAAACEEAAKDHMVYHIGNHQSMLDVAPTTSLISARVNWTPYILGAVEAVMMGDSIEKTVDAYQHGRDMSAGFSKNWVEMLELNAHIAPDGTHERIERTVDALRKGQITVFKGNYTGVNPDDLDDTIDLSKGFAENEDYSFPSFHYILQDCITVDN